MNDTLALVPAYNPGIDEYIATIKSLLDQTMAIDICVINDGSIDASAFSAISDASLKILDMPVNGGITKALKFGTEYGLSKGYKYFCRLDVGDIALPNRVEIQHRYMEENPEVSVVGALSRVLNLRGQVQYTHGQAGETAAVKRQLYFSAPFKHSTYFIRAQALAKFGTYDPDFNGSEDNELLRRLIKESEIHCLSDILIDYVDDPSGISTRSRGRQLRKRLKSLLRHPEFRLLWVCGVLRTSLLIITPYGMAKKISSRFWKNKKRQGS